MKATLRDRDFAGRGVAKNNCGFVLAGIAYHMKVVVLPKGRDHHVKDEGVQILDRISYEIAEVKDLDPGMSLAISATDVHDAWERAEELSNATYGHGHDTGRAGGEGGHSLPAHILDGIEALRRTVHRPPCTCLPA